MAQWEIGYTDPIKVMVRRSDAQRASEFLQHSKADARQIDWSQVDVNEPGVLADGAMCEFCGHALGGLEATTRACPSCNAELHPGPEIDEPVRPADGAPFSVRWSPLRRIGAVMLFLSMGLWAVGPGLAIPLLGVTLLVLAFGGPRSPRVARPLPRR
jgi:hypothetical protein